VRILIAGLGAIGQRHARNLRLLFGAGLELLAFRQRRESFVVTELLARDDQHDVEAALGITAFQDLDRALAARPDAVFVCTPSSQHLEIAQRAANAGCHLFIEKPLSHTLLGVEELRQTVAAKGLVAMVGCQWRYHPCVLWLRDLLQAGTLGELLRAEIDYAEYLPDWHPYEDYRTSYAARADLGGGVVLTQIHDYDLAWWLFGAPRTVRAAGGHQSALEIDVEDTIEAHLDGGRVPVIVRQSFAARPPRRTVAVFGVHGAVTVDLLAARITSTSRAVSPVAFPGYRRNEMFVAAVAQFAASIEGRETPAVPLADGIAVLTLALAVKDAMHSGCPVEIM
jgi:predicted dehydrogenase